MPPLPVPPSCFSPRTNETFFAMAIARELVQVAPTLFFWQNYDPAVKADLFSTALATPNGSLLVDPIPLHDSQLRPLSQHRSIAGIVVTNANHQRAANCYSDQFSAPIFAQRDSFPDRKPSRFVEIGSGTKICDELEVIAIEGAVAGEIALYQPANGGTLITGDALINFEPYGFTFLPRKYCANEKEMRRSLRKLLLYQTERMLFAHGTPILAGASARLQQLLDADL
jgi:glyoxylase-like metal-dependent hydrolase (beta-lactamase superfamily II)